MARHAPKTSFGTQSTTTLSTAAVRAVLAALGVTEELFFDLYRTAIEEQATARRALHDPRELRRMLEEERAEVARLRARLGEG